MFHNWNPTWNGFHPAMGNKFEKTSTCQISLVWVARTLSRNVEMHRICLHAITLERNRPPSNAKLVLNAKWKCDVRLCGCRKSGTKWTNPKSLRKGKSSMQWVVMKPGCSENILKWLARDCAGNKAENSVAVILNSLSAWTLFTAKAWSYPDYQDQRKESCHRVQGVFCQKSEEQDWGFALSVTFILKLIPLGCNADTASDFF